MSEEMKEMQTNEVTETMADYEDHFDDANPWNRVQDYMDKKTVLPVKIEGVVNGGVIVMVEGLRGFVPASKLSLSYIENLEDYLLKKKKWNECFFKKKKDTVWFCLGGSFFFF